MNRRLKRALILGAAWLGANLVAAALFRRTRTAYARGRPHFLLVHGGDELCPRAEELTDAVVSVFMGGLVLDLRHLGPPVDPLALDVQVVMGGLEIQVPDDWRVALEIVPGLGGGVDDRPAPVDSRGPAALRVTGRVTLGGVEVTGG